MVGPRSMLTVPPMAGPVLQDTVGLRCDNGGSTVSAAETRVPCNGRHPCSLPGPVNHCISVSPPGVLATGPIFFSSGHASLGVTIALSLLKPHLPPSPHRPRDAHTTYVHTFACAGNRASARGVLLFKYGSTLIPSPPYDAIDRTTVTCPDCGVVLTGGMCDACENGDFDSRCGCAGHRPLHSCAAAAVCPDIQFAWGSCAVPVRFTVHK